MTEHRGELLLECIEGKMGLLRLGPVSMPLYSSAEISAVSEMLLVLRAPRVEAQTTGGVVFNPSFCELSDIWIDDAEDEIKRPHFEVERDRLGVIWPGQKLRAVLINNSRTTQNVGVVIEGDGARLMHWRKDCSSHGCSSCKDDLLPKTERRSEGEVFLEMITSSPTGPVFGVPRLRY
jgi:hypothetical protein